MPDYTEPVLGSLLAALCQSLVLGKFDEYIRLRRCHSCDGVEVIEVKTQHLKSQLPAPPAVSLIMRPGVFPQRSQLPQYPESNILLRACSPASEKRSLTESGIFCMLEFCITIVPRCVPYPPGWQGARIRTVCCSSGHDKLIKHLPPQQTV